MTGEVGYMSIKADRALRRDWEVSVRERYVLNKRVRDPYDAWRDPRNVPDRGNCSRGRLAVRTGRAAGLRGPLRSSAA